MLKHVLTPRIKATHVAFDSLKNYLDAIYDVTVVYEGKTDKGQRKESPSMTGESPFCALAAVCSDTGTPTPHVD